MPGLTLGRCPGEQICLDHAGGRTVIEVLDVRTPKVLLKIVSPDYEQEIELNLAKIVFISVDGVPVGIRVNKVEGCQAKINIDAPRTVVVNRREIADLISQYRAEQAAKAVDLEITLDLGGRK